MIEQPAPPTRIGSVTLQQIALRAGCSVSAVSKALNNAKGSTGVSAALGTQIRRIADEMGYCPNYHARSLVARQGHTLGLLLRLSAQDLFWRHLVQGISEAARELEHDLLMISPADGISDVDQAIRYLGERRVDALIALGAMYGGQEARKLEMLNLPIILVGGDLSSTLPTVSLDIRPGVVAAVQHLVSLGHREILWVEVDTPAGRPAVGLRIEHDRVAALQDATRAMGIKLREIRLPMREQEPQHIGQFVAACRTAFREYLVCERPCTAVMVYNELTAIGVMAALADAGYSVPQDVSVIGFDNINAQWVVPAMTVVSLRLSERGILAAQLATKLINSGDSLASWQGYVEWIPATLEVMQSTAEVKT